MRHATLALLLALATGCASGPELASRDAVSAAGARLAPPVGKWRLIAFAGIDLPVTGDVTLVVQENGKLGGSGGCNAYFGQWALGAGQDSIGPVGATRRLCEPATMDVETRYFDRLSRVGGWLPTDSGMLLTDARGDALLAFRAQD